MTLFGQVLAAVSVRVVAGGSAVRTGRKSIVFLFKNGPF